MKLPKTPLTIGSDPEIVIVSRKTKNPLNAYTLIEDNGRNKAFGLDGNSATAEIRPKPSKDPLEHAKNIRKLLEEYRKNIFYRKAYSQLLMPSAQSRSIGGHIHFGHPMLANGASITNVCRSLDILLAVPMMFVENKNHAIERKQHYGLMTDYRTNNWGIEYRTLSSWLANEQLTRAVLTLGYSVVYDVIENGFLPRLYPSIGPSMSSLFALHDLEYFDSHLDKIFADVKNLSLYPMYKKHIDYLLENAKKRNCLYNQDIQHGWKIPYVRVRKAILYSIMTLIKKMIATLPLVDTLEETGRNVDFVKSSDSMEEVKNNLNRTLNFILDDRHIDVDADFKRIYIQRANTNFDIYFELNESIISRKKALRLLRLSTDTIKAFGKRNLTIGARYGFDGDSGMKITFSPRVADEKSYIPEMVSFLGLLYVNNAIYKSYRINKKTGKKVSISLLAKQIVKPVEKIKKQRRKQVTTLSDSVIREYITTIDPQSSWRLQYDSIRIPGEVR